MTVIVDPLRVLERYGLICEAPLCSAAATHIAAYHYALDNEPEQTYSEVLCDRHAAELEAELHRARRHGATA